MTADVREIILDTESTGLDPAEGHRLVEIGCVELKGHLPTGRTFHAYLNPCREVPPDAVRIHGLTTEFLKDKPLFSEQVGPFLDFIAGAQLVIHNAEFDMKFINAELKAAGLPAIPKPSVTDTLAMARRKFPGQPASLDALCRRFKVDNEARTLHGALLDAQLLAEVYLELMGGRQHGLGLGAAAEAAARELKEKTVRQDRPRRSFPPAAEELERHAAFVERLGADSLWKK